ncbi:hypothetical protein GBAR_LOCUS9300 [Geodia barretti]|uniref:Uncharacterized protein n=1 Tax=Geodia barretti TaxID=519541 RepID=A0AA35RNR0_GEOBA|nr:hypothetical protein GBAR_LOCUS9300 [Geodia barretti]
MQYIYRFSTVVVHFTWRGKTDKGQSNQTINFRTNTFNHFEEELYANSLVRTSIGIDTLALFLMLFLIVFAVSCYNSFQKGVG